MFLVLGARPCATHQTLALVLVFTLALKAMSLTNISTVKRMVKVTFRMSEAWFISSDWL